MASGPITSLQIEGGKVEAVIDFLFLGFNITVDGDCRHEVREWLVLGRKAMTNLDSTLKSRDITLPTKVRIVKVIIFPAVTYGCESWTLKKAEHQRTDAFKLWCWRRLLRFLWTMMRSNQSILNKINPEYSLEGLLLMLKLQSPDMNSQLIGKDLDAGKDWGQKEKKTSENEMAGWHHWCNRLELGQTLGNGEGQGGLVRCSPWGLKESDMTG